jgi:hypothetical protein
LFYVLLEEDRSETRVESADSLLAGNFGKTGDKTISEARRRHQSDAGGLERAEGNVGKELS